MSGILLIDNVATMLCIRVLSLEVNLGTLLFTDFWKIRFAPGIFCNECPERFISSISINPILPLANRRWKNKVTIIIAASVGTALTVGVVALLAIQQQQIQLPEQQQVLEQLESNLTFSQVNISSSNSSNNTMPLEQSELVVSDTVENTTNTVDEAEQGEDESEEDVRRGHLEDDLAEKSAESNP
jgi:hypothetical protein